MDFEGANKFIQIIVNGQGQNIYRMKGFLAISGSEKKYVFHSVGMMFTIEPLVDWKKDEKRECLFVIIGKNLKQEWLEGVFKSVAIQKFVEVENDTLKRFLGN